MRVKASSWVCLASFGAVAIGFGCSDAGISAVETTATSTTGSGGSTATAGGASTASTGGTGGQGGVGGEGGAPVVWPSCDEAPTDVAAMTIAEIWTADPAQPLEAWVEGVYVTAISGGGCMGGKPCQFFVQQEPSFASPQDGAHQALRVFASSSAAEHFVALAIGDRIDLRAFAWRHPEGELYFQVGQATPGCARVVGSAELTPVEGLTLEDLTVEAYEQTLGPLLIKVLAVSGKPKQPNETFALWPAFQPGMQPLEEVTSLSPYFLPGHVFSGFTPEIIYNFESVSGVFGLFVPPNDPPQKYEEIYLRDMADAVVGGT